MGRWSRQEIEAAFESYQAIALEAGRTGKWDRWADQFTEDATYVEHHFGRFCGRDAIYRWISAITTPYPMNHMIYFPWTWHVVDEERGWIICELMNRMKDPGDGSLHEEPNITILHYAGDGLWSYEEDAYDWQNMARMISGWQAVKERCEKLSATGRDPRDERHLAAIEGVEVKREAGSRGSWAEGTP